MLDRAFALLARRWHLFLPLALVFGAPDLALALCRRFVHAPQLLRWTSALYLALGLAGELAYAIAIAASFQTLLFPQRVLSVPALVKATMPRLPVFLLTRLMLTFAFFTFALIIPVGLLRIPPGTQLNPFQAGIAALSVLIGLRFLLSWALVPLAIIVERKAFFSASIRSSELMRSSFGTRTSLDNPSWRLLAGIAPALVAGITLTAAVQGWNFATDRPLLDLINLPFETERSTACILRGLIAICCTPLVWAAISTLYVECRMRRDGLDFQVRLIERASSAPASEELSEVMDWSSQ